MLPRRGPLIDWLRGCSKHDLDGFSAGHPRFDAECFGLRRRVDNSGIEQVFGIDKRMLGSPFRDGDSLAELCCRRQVINAAANDADRSHDGTVLTVNPTVTHAVGTAAGELHRTGDRSGEGF